MKPFKLGPVIFLILCLPGCSVPEADEGTKSTTSDRTISLADVYLSSTITADGQGKHPNYKEPYFSDLINLRNDPRTTALTGPAAFLVRTDNFGDAIKGTRLGLLADAPAGKPIRSDPRFQDHHYWLAVYLGCGSSSNTWVIEGVELHGSTIRVSCWPKPTEKVGVTADHVQYMAWVALGRLSPGDYKLEIHDSKRRTSLFHSNIKIAVD